MKSAYSKLLGSGIRTGPLIRDVENLSVIGILRSGTLWARKCADVLAIFDISIEECVDVLAIFDISIEECADVFAIFDISIEECADVLAIFEI